MKRISEETQEQLTIRNLLEINNRLSDQVDKFLPDFTVEYDEDQQEIQVYMKLNGKTTSTIINKSTMNFLTPSDQASVAAEDLIFPFQQLIAEALLERIKIINDNQTKGVSTL